MYHTYELMFLIQQTETYVLCKSVSTASAINMRSLSNQHTLHNPTSSQLKTKKHISSKPPNIPNYTVIHTDRVGKLSQGLLTYIKHNITFIDLNIPTNINTCTIQNYKRSESTLANIHITVSNLLIVYN